MHAQGLAHFNRRRAFVPPAALPAGRDYVGGGDGAIFFTKNGRFLGIAFRQVNVKVCTRVQILLITFYPRKPHARTICIVLAPDCLLALTPATDTLLCPFSTSPTRREQRPLYPVIGLDSHRLVTANFGAKPFAFDVPTFESWFTGTKLNCYAPSAPEEHDEVRPAGLETSTLHTAAHLVMHERRSGAF